MAIIFTTVIAFGLIVYVSAFASSSAISLLGGTTSLLLLAVFAVVNVAVLVLRRDVVNAGGHFKTPTVLPVIGFIASLYLVTPLSGRPAQQYMRRRRVWSSSASCCSSSPRLINKQTGHPATPASPTRRSSATRPD